MRPITTSVTVSGSGAAVVTNPIGFDYFANPFNVGIGVVQSAGSTAVYTIQHTFDDIQSSTYSAATGNWYNHDDSSLVSVSGNANGNFAFACTASRLSSSGISGTVTVTYIQSGY